MAMDILVAEFDGWSEKNSGESVERTIVLLNVGGIRASGFSVKEFGSKLLSVSFRRTK